jgi:hypothetical protein
MSNSLSEAVGAVEKVLAELRNFHFGCSVL